MRKLNKYVQKISEIEPLRTLLKIRDEGKKALKSNLENGEQSKSAKKVWRLLWVIVALFISVGGVLKSWEKIRNVVESIDSLTEVIIPLFIGISFSILLSIPSSIAKLLKMRLDEGTTKRGKRAYKQLASIMQYQILLCCCILSIRLIMVTIPNELILSNHIYALLSLILLSRFIVVIIYLIIRYHYLISIEIR